MAKSKLIHREVIKHYGIPLAPFNKGGTGRRIHKNVKAIED
jgi:hypothetical protein